MCSFQVPYNIERILFLFSGSDQVVSFMKSFEKDGKVEIPLSLREKVNYEEAHLYTEGLK